MNAQTDSMECSGRELSQTVKDIAGLGGRVTNMARVGKRNNGMWRLEIVWEKSFDIATIARRHQIIKLEAECAATRGNLK